MDIIYYFNLFKRWAWLLALGLFFGLIGGYLVSYFQEPVYEATTKLMITRQIQNENPDFAGLNSQQLVQTYVEILKTKPLLDTASERVGIEIDPEDITVQQILDTQIIEIKVEDYNPEKAADLANTMVLVLIEQNEDMQAGQYAASEDRLLEQIEQVKQQIDALQTEYDQASTKDYQDQLTLVDEQINAIQTELSTLQTEIERLNPGYREADRILMAEKQIRVTQLQSMFETYERIRANLLILQRPMETSDTKENSRLQQLQSTINLYQNLYLTSIEELEKVRLARLQQTPNVVHIEKAAIPKKPIRPIPILYTAVSGVVGLIMAVIFVFLFEAWRNNQARWEKVLQTESENFPETVKISSELPVTDLKLGKRPTDALAMVGINKVGQLMDKLAEGEEAVLAISGFGQRSLMDAKKKLRSLGYEISKSEKAT